MIDALKSAFQLEDLRKKMLYTVLILMVYRFAAHVPVPGVDVDAITALFNQSGAGRQFIDILDLLSGGAVANFSVMAAGVYPYITASIIFQLLIPIIPALERLASEPGGQDKLNQYTYYVAIPMAALQAISQVNIFSGIAGQPIIPNFGLTAEGWLPTIAIISTMTAGTMLAIWLGELITEQGIGNGLSIIIFAGIVSRVPTRLTQIFVGDYVWLNFIAFLIITLATVLVIVVVQEGVRRIPVQYGRRVRGRKVYGGAATHVPLKVNTAGMIPLIFSQAVITFPAVAAGFFQNSDTLWVAELARTLQRTFGSGPVYWIGYFLLTAGFTYFYTDVMIQNQNLAESLQRQGGFVPGIRPGRRTQDYINKVVHRITIVGALFLGLIAIMPGITDLVMGLIITGAAGGTTASNPALIITGAGLIIVVGVVIDTMRQLEAQLLMRNLEGFLK